MFRFDRHHVIPTLSVCGAGVLALAVAACDESPSSAVAGASDAAAPVSQQEAHIPGNGNGTAIYEAVLTPLNANAAYGIEAVTGRVQITERAGRVTVRLNGRKLAPGTVHLQHIHGGGTCPTAAQDANGDGFIDVGEGAAVYGPIVVSLDDDLSNLAMQVEGFPTPANQGGAIHYVASDDIEALNAAVQGALGEDLNLATRHIVLHSVDPAAGLPATVGSIGDFPAELTLPVACGEVVQLNRPN